MSNVMIAGSNNNLAIGTMGANGTLSEEMDTSGFTLLGLLTDGAANGTLNFLVSDQAISVTGTNNYRPLRDSSGVAVAYTLPTGSNAFKESDMRVLVPYRYVRLLSSVAQTGFKATLIMKA